MESSAHTSPPATTASRRLGYLAIVLAFCAGGSLAVDLPVANFLRADRTNAKHRVPSDLRKIVALSEIFSHGLGVALIGVTVFVLDRQHRRCLPRVLGCAYGAGLAANVVKMLLARTRPNHFDFHGNVWQTFAGWLPVMFGHGDSGEYSSAIQSFPSAHSATAVGLAIGLSRLYPHGRWLFTIFAALALLQRIDVGAHFVSDTLAAASLACLVSAAVLDPRWAGRWFDRWEISADPSA